MGKQIDIAIAERRFDDAVARLKDAERDLTFRRRRVGNRINSRSTPPAQRKIDEVTMKQLNAKMDKICASLRGKNSLIRKAARMRPVRVAKKRSGKPRSRAPRHRLP